jgi:hypothetical protein
LHKPLHPSGHRITKASSTSASTSTADRPSNALIVHPNRSPNHWHHHPHQHTFLTAIRIQLPGRNRRGPHRPGAVCEHARGRARSRSDPGTSLTTRSSAVQRRRRANQIRINRARGGAGNGDGEDVTQLLDAIRGMGISSCSSQSQSHAQPPVNADIELVGGETGENGRRGAVSGTVRQEVQSPRDFREQVDGLVGALGGLGLRVREPTVARVGDHAAGDHGKASEDDWEDVNVDAEVDMD